MHARRAAIVAEYDRALAGLPLTRPAATASDERHAHHLYAVMVEPLRGGRTRDQVQRR